MRETFAGRTAHRLTPERIAALKSFITTSMEQLHVPGTAIALIDHGKVVFEGGFGVRNVATSQPVDANTLFMVASNTKGMSTLLLSELVDQGKLRWDEPVVDVFPTFRLGDAATTKSVLVKHLVCACTGLPRKDLEWIFTTTPQTPVTKTFDFLAATAPTSKFGEVFQYNNLMATAAGYIGGHVAYPQMELGAAYDRAMQTMVFDPLGMRSTTFDTAKARAGDHADPYGLDIDGKTAPDNLAIDDAIAPYRPAGGAWSSVHDMTRYVENELALGVLPNGRRLVSEKNLLQRRERTVAIGETGWYGMGLMSDATYGVTIVHHGGDLPGYHSDWYAFPDAQVGAVFLTNADQGAAIRGPFMRRILEVLYDGKPEAAEDVATSAKRLFESIAAQRREDHGARGSRCGSAARNVVHESGPRTDHGRPRRRRRDVQIRGLLEPSRHAQERGRHDVVHHDRSRQSGVRLRARHRRANAHPARRAAHIRIHAVVMHDRGSTGMFDDNAKGCICALLYPVIFEHDPIERIDRVLDVVVRARALHASPEEYRVAIDAALGSDEDLATMLPQPHSDAAVRRYLEALRSRLSDNS